jgi:hypothetical protein
MPRLRQSHFSKQSRINSFVEHVTPDNNGGDGAGLGGDDVAGYEADD